MNVNVLDVEFACRRSLNLKNCVPTSLKWVWHSTGFGIIKMEETLVIMASLEFHLSVGLLRLVTDSR